jgi:hypothetical protein
MLIGCPKHFEANGAIVLAVMSVPPPAWNPTYSFIGLLGNLSTLIFEFVFDLFLLQLNIKQPKNNKIKSFFIWFYS